MKTKPLCIYQINRCVYVRVKNAKVGYHHTEDAVKVACGSWGFQALEVGSIARRNLFSFSSRESPPHSTRGDLSSCHPIDPLQRSLIWGKGH